MTLKVADNQPAELLVFVSGRPLNRVFGMMCQSSVDVCLSSSVGLLLNACIVAKRYDVGGRRWYG